MNIRRFIAAGLSAVILLLTGCSAANEDVIVIGGLSVLTGTSSVYGIACSNGTKLAIKEINQSGGVLGKQVKFELQDEKGEIEEAINAYNKLTGRGAKIIIGDVMSKPCIAVAELASADGTTLITPTATADVITELGGNIFRVCFTDRLQGEVMAQYAFDDANAKTAAVMYNTSDDYSAGIATAFKNEAEKLGLEIIAYEGYGADDKDFRTQLTKIKGLSPDVIFLPDYYSSVALIVAQARGMGIDGLILGADGWDGITAAISDDSIGILDNCRYSAHFAVTDSDEKVADFVEKYTEEYGYAPTSLAALGYDAAYITAAAIQKAGSADSDAVAAALREIENECVTGRISFDENGNSKKQVAILALENGKVKLDTKKETY